VKKIDTYIIKQFLSTYFFAIALIVSIAVVFDASEKIDDFIDKEAPLNAVIFDYYLNFIPYFANLFSSLFVFIAVIYFTSKMAYASEIIAILSSGVSFFRLLYPYFIGAIIITAFNFSLGYYIIPEANKERLEFQNTYLKGAGKSGESDVHKQIEPNVYVYMENFNLRREQGYGFSMEKFDNNKLVSKLNANRINWNEETNTWTLENYKIRRFHEDGQTIEVGAEKDTSIAVTPDDFTVNEKIINAMTPRELDKYIEQQQLRGTSAVTFSLLEKHKRIAFPFSIFILTFMGVILSSKKIRGGIGLQIGLGILLSFTYILFMKFSDTFAISGLVSPMFAVWIPNIIYAGLTFVLLPMAPK
jgi:lipopolysaccharide export system permease protein